MTPQQLINMIQKIKQLPDGFLIQVLTATTAELLKRTGTTLKNLREELDKQ